MNASIYDNVETILGEQHFGAGYVLSTVRCISHDRRRDTCDNALIGDGESAGESTYSTASESGCITFSAHNHGNTFFNQ